jgi:phosphatidylglycerophosphate synthase
MPDKGTKKKVTRVEGGETSSAARETRTFVASDESKAKAKKFRIFAILSWIVAIGLEVVAILQLKSPPIKTWLLIVLIVADLVFAVIGSLLWKKANRFDPASEKDKFRFFVQNQLGAIIAVIAFLPLVLLIFTNKDLKGKQKGLVGAVAVIAMLIAGFVGVDFNPPSIEEYAEQTAQVESLTGQNHVYWTKSGTKYHVLADCQHINTKKTDEIFEGTVAQARELKNISELCKTCAERWKKEKGLPAGTAAAIEEQLTE